MSLFLEVFLRRDIFAGSSGAGFNPDLLQPCTSLKQCNQVLNDISKDLEANPDDIDSEGLKFFFDSEVKRLERNKEFVENTSRVRQPIASTYFQNDFLTLHTFYTRNCWQSGNAIP